MELMDLFGLTFPKLCVCARAKGGVWRDKVAFQLNEDKTIEHDGFTTTMFYEC